MSMSYKIQHSHSFSYKTSNSKSSSGKSSKSSKSGSKSGQSSSRTSNSKNRMVSESLSLNSMDNLDYEIRSKATPEQINDTTKNFTTATSSGLIIFPIFPKVFVVWPYVFISLSTLFL